MAQDSQIHHQGQVMTERACALVREAGGRTNEFLGEDGLTKGNAVLASTPQLYSLLAGLLKISS
jgi:hypothetical protein